MSVIFVSYRRSDSQGEAGRLFDDLVPFFGEHRVFMDVAAIEAGRDFRKAIEEGVTRCGVLLAIMGPEWLNSRDESGARRLDNPADFVRIETASALKRNIAVIPVLVRSAKMPSAEQLPDDLKELAYRNAVELTHARWKSDLQLLVEALRHLLADANRNGTGKSASLADSVPPRQKVVAPAKTKAAREGSTPMDPAVLQRVSRELAHHIGQIAEIVVKRAAGSCNSVEELYLKVAEEIDSREERETFLRKRTQAASPPWLAVAGASAPAKDASEAPERDQLPVANQPRTPPMAAAGPRVSSRRKYLLVAAGGCIVLALAIIFSVRFATSKAAPQFHNANHAADISRESFTPPPRPAAPAAREVEKPVEQVRLSQGVSQDLLVTKVLPVYPPLARQAHVQGTVVLEANISKDGAVESLRAISGHPMLVPAAIDAVKQWRYKPYVLNGEPARVNTQISVTFTLTGG